MLFFKCNYNTKKLDQSIPLFYLEMLDYFQELCQVNQDSYKSDLILWNNQDITIEGKSLYRRRWIDNGIDYIQDLLNENGKFLTFEEFNQKYNMSADFLNFFQILASIPPNLKSKAASTLRPNNSVLDNSDTLDFSTEKSVLLLTIRTNTLSMRQALSCHVTTNVKLTHPEGTMALQRIALRSDYGIHADTKLISHDSAFSLSSILLTSDFIRRLRVSRNLAFVLSQVFPYNGYKCNLH